MKITWLLLMLMIVAFSSRVMPSQYDPMAPPGYGNVISEKPKKIEIAEKAGNAFVKVRDYKNAAYGSVDKTTPVKKPLMVLATLPRKLSPGEKVTLPVTVFAMENNIKNVNISLKVSDGISIVGNDTQTLNFAKPDEQMTYFELDVSKAKGINTVEVIASGHGEKSSYQVELDVINPNPYSTKAPDFVLEGTTSKTINFETFGVEGTNSAQVEFSTLPPMDFTGRLQYLIRYPHGCVEQTTSSVFPQLYLSDIFDLTFDKNKARICLHIYNYDYIGDCICTFIVS